MTELSDDLLVAYVDGQLARDQSRAVKRVLDNDALSAQRVAALKAAHERLESAFNALLAGEFADLTGMMPPSQMDEEDLPPEPESRRGGRGLAVVLTSVIALALGAAGGYLAHSRLVPPAPPPEVAVTAPPAATVEPETPPVPPAPVEQKAEAVAPSAPVPAEEPLITGSLPAVAKRTPSWQDDAERAFSLYGRSSLEVGLDSQSNPEFVRFQLAKAIGPQAVLPDLSGQGLAFKRLEILQRDGVPLAQMLYLPEQGEPVALYASPGEPERHAPTTLHATGDVGMASWTDGHVSYLLAGRLPEDKIMALAKAIREQAKEAPGQNPGPN